MIPPCMKACSKGSVMLTRSPPWLMQSARASAHVLMDR